MKLAFVCVQNAGRSQMAAAFAEREREERGLGWEIVTGGTDPADHVHEEVVDAMADVGIDVSDRDPREIDDGELDSCDYVATMGCSTLDVDASEVRDWALDDPDGRSPAAVAAIRDEIRERVDALFDEAEAAAATDA